MEIIRDTGSCDRSALYVDGKLRICGDHYLIEDEISNIFNIIEQDSDDFLNSKDEPYLTLTELIEKANLLLAKEEEESRNL